MTKEPFFPSCLVLASRQAMLEDALILCGAMEQRCAGSATLLACGELLWDSTAVATASRSIRVIVDNASPIVHSRTSVWRRLMKAGPLRVLWTPFEMARRRGQARAVLRREQPEVIVVFEDRIPNPEMIWLAECARLKIPAMLVRYALSSSESDAWTRRDKAGYSLDRGALAWARRLFALTHPRHALDLGMGRQIFYSLWDSLILAASGMAGTQPWIVGGGCVAVAALQGPIDFEEAVRLTQAPERFYITGQPSWDVMASAVKQRNDVQDLHHGASAPPVTLVCALPQWGEHLQISWPEHMEKIAELCTILGHTGYDVTLSLHPKAQRADYEAIASLHRLHISDVQLSVLLPGADLFLASWSSTLRWAAMLGIASVNLDWANQGYTMFSELESLPVSTRPEDLAPLLMDLGSNIDRRKRLGTQLFKESSTYGSIDGQSAQRILSLVQNLAERDPG